MNSVIDTSALPSRISIEPQLYNALVEISGIEYVKVSQEILTTYQTATFASSNIVLAVVCPSKVVEVQQILQVCGSHNVRVFPVSGGRNWGLGSTVPPSKVSIVLDLGRMNQILDYNAELSYITVQPGVTFKQVYNFLKEKKSELFLAMIGGPADASLIGNAVERGDGVGPYGDRAFNISNFEVILGDGTLLPLGFSAFGFDKIAALTPHALGPDLHGLFLQSSFGIITKMTFWLRPKPKVFHGFVFKMNKGRDSNGLMNALRNLQAAGVIKPNSFALWSVWKVLAGQMRYPWNKTNNTVLPHSELRSFLPKLWAKTEWCGYIALYSADAAHARATEKLIKRELAGKTDGHFPLNGFMRFMGNLFHTPIKLFFNFDCRKFFDSFYDNSVALGTPIDMNVGSLYWRKKDSSNVLQEPHRDGCGLHWLCNVVPFTSKDIQAVNSILEAVTLKFHFEPNVAFLNTSERIMRMFAIVAYDRHVPGEDEKALACVKECHNKLIEAGYPPFRVGIQLQDDLPIADLKYRFFIDKIKDLSDAHNTLSSEKYSFR
jgi:4-cresol dehydrogenase (hydroxylating)